MPEPTSELVERVVSTIKTAADADYFFDHLSSPMWIKPLRDAGMFADPPAPIRQGDFFQLPAWSASRYLVRMAPFAPKAVAETIRTIRSTDNGRVTLDLVDAVIAMPDDVAVTMTDLAGGWVQSPFLLSVPTRVGELIVKLAKAGATEASLRLLTELLRLEVPIDDEGNLVHPTAQSHLADWNYRELLEKAVPALSEADDLMTLKGLSSLLGSVMSVQDSSGRTPDDHSWLWRPAIESHEQNRDSGPLNALVSALRDASEHILRNEPARLDTVLGVLRAHLSTLTERLVLHLLRLFAEAGSDELTQALTDRIYEVAVHHEYWHLLHERFSDLDPEAQKVLLEALAAGPDLGAEITGEERDLRRAAWQRRYLAAIEERLPAEWFERFASLGLLRDAPDHPDFLAYMTFGWAGPTSPITSEELERSSIDEIIGQLRSWRPDDRWMGPSIEGLARELTDAVVHDPARFANDATEFIDLDPTYVRGVLAGFRTAVGNKSDFDWSNVIELARRVMDKPRNVEPRDEELSDDADLNWVPARTEVARLLSAGMQKRSAEIPLRLRDRVWATLAVLVEDPNPDPEYEARFGGSNMDPTTLSLNTVRGQAFEALMDYTMWVRRDQEQRDDRQALAEGLQSMPEVAQVLNRHLDPSVDPSPAIRSVYGRKLPWLVLIDERWTTENLPKLFPNNPDLAPLRDAAWDAYILYCRVYDSTFAALSDEYRQAIDRLGPQPSDQAGGRNDVEAHLAEHLMMVFWRGKAGLEEGGLVRYFFQKANDATRAAALAFLGRGLDEIGGSTEEPWEDVRSRLRALWEWRLATARAAEGANHSERELRQFGWWYGSGAFDEAWALPNLAEAVRLAGSPEGEHKVLMRLQTAVNAQPLLTIQVLSSLIRRDKERWIALGHRDEVRAILDAGLRSGDHEAIKAAKEVVHRLGAMGFRDYRSLIK